MSISVFESKPRWPGAPKLCKARNTFAFENTAQIKRFKAKRCPSASVAHTFTCRDCGLIHVIWAKEYEN